jgi:hypothetical protein
MSDMTLDQLIYSISNKTGLHTELVERILSNGILEWYEEAKKNQYSRRRYLKEEAKEMGLTLETIFDVETKLMNGDLKFLEDQGDQFMEALFSGHIPADLVKSIKNFLAAIDRTENITNESRDNIFSVAHALYDLDKSHHQNLVDQ